MVEGIRVVGVSLTTVKEIWLWFLLPAVVRCAAYIVDLSLATGVLHRHFNRGDIRLGISTLLIIYSPSVTFFIITVSKPKGWIEHGNAPSTTYWFIKRIGQLFLFPVWAIYRYGKQLFWSIEALYQQGSAREEALDRANKPSRIELYLFLHAFLHAAPQATLQLYVIFNQHGQNILIDGAQVFCVASSLVLLSLTLASFQRFESQRLAGREEPWVIPPCKLNENPKGIALSHASPEKSDDEVRKPSYPFFNLPKLSVSPPSPTSSLVTQANACKEENSPYPASTESLGNGEVNIEPRPVSGTAESPPQRTLVLPKHTISVKGLEKDDPLGVSVSFLWWLFFLLSRALALITFSQFFPGATAAVCMGHCIASIAYLLSVNGFRSVNATVQQLCLGVIYLFCFIEYKTKFNHVKILYALYFLVVFIENTAVSLVWWFAVDLWQGWWYKYTFLIIFGSYTASMLAMGSYMMLLKPKVTSFYIIVDEEVTVRKTSTVEPR